MVKLFLKKLLQDQIEESLLTLEEDPTTDAVNNLSWISHDKRWRRHDRLWRAAEIHPWSGILLSDVRGGSRNVTEELITAFSAQ